MKTIKVEVLKKDIKNGVVKSSSTCPIALAVKRKLKNHIIDVEGDIIYVKEEIKGERKVFGYSYNSGRFISFPKTRDYTGYPPQKVTTFIERFDSGKRVRPISFNLKLLND